MKFGGGAYEGPYTFASRFEKGEGTNPEELLAAAHAGCFSMALAAGLTKLGHPPTRVRTEAKLHLEKLGEGFHIPKVELVTSAVVPGIDEATFHYEAETARQSCPVSKLFAGAQITLQAKLEPEPVAESQ
jgi:osmotically inducible protein OsmC